MTPILPRVPLAEVPPLGPEPPSDAQRFAQWLRCGLAPAAFRRGWRQRLGIAFVLAGVVLLLGFGGQLSEWQQVVLWSGLGIFAAILTRGLWLGLFGPVLFFDLVRMARKAEHFCCAAATLSRCWRHCCLSIHRGPAATCSARCGWISTN